MTDLDRVSKPFQLAEERRRHSTQVLEIEREIEREIKREIERGSR